VVLLESLQRVRLYTGGVQYVGGTLKSIEGSIPDIYIYVYVVFSIFFYSSSDMKIGFEKKTLARSTTKRRSCKGQRGLYHEVWCHF